MFGTDNLKDARAAFARHKDAVRNALHEYREAVSNCSCYAPDFASQKLAEAKTEASGKIAQADREMHDSVMKITAAARRDMCFAITSAPREKFSSVMREYRRHDIKMTETEIRAFAEQAAGSYMELRILQSVAASGGFKVPAPNVTEIEADIKRIERVARIPSMYAPTEYVKEASEVLGEKPWFRDDGSVYQRSGEADALYLTTINMTRNRLEADLETVIPERWACMGPVKIERITDNKATEAKNFKESDKNESKTAAEQAKADQAERKKFAEGLTITQEDDPNAAAIMAQNEATAAKSKEILSHYVRK